ncbi:MAG TPA: LamG-like jellyroll fold domain-containing protein [Alphaproteobacteria bacterium]|nr:LamG-like jellyroll fold domain-containing protein [Alphaproteobacteria bacterium]
MKGLRRFATGWLRVTGLIVGLLLLHGQPAVTPVQPGAAASPAGNASTGRLWLRFTGITNGMASLTLDNATDQVYEVLSKTDLKLSDWTIEPDEIWPTNPIVMPFTVAVRDRTNALFIWAADWTDVTESGNTVPDWWFWKYFGTLALSDTNVDTAGNTLSYDYQNGIDPLHPDDDYNGQLPELEIVSGSNQTGSPGSFLPLPLAVRATDSNSNPLTNVPITLSVSDEAQLATTTNDALASSLRLRTDSNGLVSARVYIPAGSVRRDTELFVWVLAQSGSNTVQTNFTEFVDLTGGVTPMLAVGGERIMELFPTGDLVSWGGNRHGELGDFTYLDSTNPVHVVGLTNLIKIASGLNHSLALDSRGIVWAWGENGSGELGAGGAEDSSNLPGRVPGITNAVAIAAHGYFNGGDPGLSLAVAADGTVWAWGTGNGYWVGPSPVQITGASNMVSVAVGAGHALALKDDGTVWAWGRNTEGELGNGTRDDSTGPVQVIGLSHIVAICAGDYFSLALDTNGVVWAWGDNNEGQLGNEGTETESDVPVRVTGVTNVRAIAAGVAHSLALDNSGRLWAWGDDSAGQLGDGGSVGSTELPIPILQLSNVVAVAAGSDASVALDGDGNVWQWGSSDSDGTNWNWDEEGGNPSLAEPYVDVYQGCLPNLTMVNGDDQTPHAGMEFPQPLIFRVTDTNGMALSNAPVSAEVIAGDMELRTVSGGSDYRALRLTADSNGTVTLIGYTGRYINNPHCLVRVLAATRGRVAEVDFNERLVSTPTISITSPVDGETDLIGTDEPLTFTVDAEAAAGASIREVDYSYQTNGGDPLPLGISTQSPYSFSWANSLWWTNMFLGQYTLSAVAVDNAGAQSDPQSVSFTIALDSNGGGLPDYWQMQYFGHLGMDPDSDPDGNGQSLRYDYQNGLDPTDYYDGVLPNLIILSGNDQDGAYDSFLPLPVILEVTRTDSTGLTNAPVTLTVTNGTALLATTTNGTPVGSLVLRTDANGQIRVWVYFPPADSNVPDSTIVARAFSGSNSVTDTINEFIPLGHWRFDDTNTWVGEAGQLPLSVTNVVGVPNWSSNAVLVDSVDQAVLTYHVVETNGHANLNCQSGSLLFWFKPDWSSANVGGNGPGHWGRLMEMGANDPDLSSGTWMTSSTNGWWALYLSPDGRQLSFGTSTNGGGTANLTASIAWVSNEWYQIALTYSLAGSALYVNGQLLANGAGVTYYPDANELANGFRIGSDSSGSNQAKGAFDELQIFDYPRSATNTATYDSQLPDWWELKYFGRTGLDPEFQPAEDGFTLLLDYQRGRDPNVISVSLWATNRYVNTNAVPVQIDVLGGEPVFMAIMIDNTNPPDAKYQPFATTLNFSNAIWQPYSPSIIASLDAGDGDYNVWVGVKGLAPEAQPAWQWMPLILDTVPPMLVVTNPVAGRVAHPMIQLQGYADESLGSLTYDISNAAGVWTNQEGYITGRFCDTNLPAITTNWFQCYDIALATNGPNVVTLHAADLAGNPFTTNLSFTVDYAIDTNPPVFALSWPQNGMAIGGTNFILQGSVNDPTATVTIAIADGDGNTNIVLGTVTREGEVWANDVPLGNGTNMAAVTTTDTAGSNVVNFAVFRNDVGLTLNPLTRDQLNQSSVTISGTIGNADATIVVNGRTATVKGDGTWTVEVPMNPSGQTIFNAAVYDGGHSLIASQSFAQTEPASVILESFSRKARNHYFDWGWPYDGWVGLYNNAQGIAGPVFENGEDEVQWTYQSGGVDVGYYFNTGAIWGLFGTGGEEPRCDYIWNQVLPPAENLVLNSYSSDLFAGAPWEITSGAESTVMIHPSDPAVAGQTVTYVVQAQAWRLNSTGGYSEGLPPSSLRIRGQVLMPVADADGSIWGQTVIQSPAGAGVDVTPVAFGNYAFNAQVVELNLQMAVDNNRDGNITFDAQDQTTACNPYRFWVNNDHDGYDDAIDDYDDLNPATGSDVDNLTISCARDLEDYTRLWINTKGLTTELQNGSLLLALEWKDAVEDPRIQFFRAAEADGGTLYLTETGVAAQQVSSYGAHIIEWAHRNVLTKDNPFIFPPGFWVNLSDDQPVAHLLFDAVNRGSGQLVITIYKSDGVTKLAEGPPLYLKLQDVKEMYDRWTVGDNPNSPPATTASRVTSPYSCDSTLPAEDKYIVFVHGWNLADWEKDAYAETAFKRLYWQGYKGHFGAFQWPTGYGFGSWKTVVTDPDNFDNSEFYAWLSAQGLFGLLNNLNNMYPDRVYLMAHSMGNVVAGEALKLAGSNQVVNTYVAMQGAIPAHCYDQIADFRTIPLLLDSGTPDRYANYPANGGPCYFDGIAGARDFINFYNPNDWALAANHWQLDQDLKPDSGFGWDGTHFYVGDLETKIDLPAYTYKIFAYCDEAHCYALGAQADVGGVFKNQQVDLHSLFGFGDRHKDHSGEFNSDNMNRWQFWYQFLLSTKLMGSK